MNLRQGASMLAAGSNMLADRGQFLSEIANFGAIGIVWKGYSVNAIAGTQTYTISQPGNMGQLVGATIFATAAGSAISTETVSLTINSNQVLDNISARSISPQTNNHVNNAMPFFPLYRQLSGNDDIKFSVTGSASLTLNLVLYFLP
jgi:hypothetical protein